MTRALIAVLAAIAFSVPSAQASDGWPLTNDEGWQEAVVSVSDVEMWTTHLADIAGWQAVLEGNADRRQLKAWGLDDSVSARYVVVQNPGESQGLVRLIRFDGADQVQIRSSAQTWDTGGWLSLLTRSRGVEQNFADARTHNWTGYNDPVILHLGPDRRLRNVILRGPDGVNIAVYERMVPGLDGWPNLKKISRPFNAMQIVKDRDATVAFYRDVLGFVSLGIGNSPASHPDSNNFGLPANLLLSTPLKSAILHQTGNAPAVETGRVEFVEWGGLEGRDLSARAVPPNLGILTLRFPVSDAQARAADIEAKGGVIKSPPTTVTMAPYGDVSLFSVMTPDGVFLEFFQAL